MEVIKTLEKISFHSSMFICAVLLVGCETTTQAPPPITESEQIEEAKPPMPVERDLSLGPLPKTKPVEQVSERDIPPAKAGESSPGTSSAVYQKVFPEKGDLAGITQAHSQVLQSKGQRGLEWSENLAQRARLQSKQLAVGMCGADQPKVLSARGEAIYLVPSAKDSAGQDRKVNLSVKRFVAALMNEKAGPFSNENSGAMILGCALNQCADYSQVWMCRYK